MRQRTQAAGQFRRLILIESVDPQDLRRRETQLLDEGGAYLAAEKIKKPIAVSFRPALRVNVGQDQLAQHGREGQKERESVSAGLEHARIVPAIPARHSGKHPMSQLREPSVITVVMAGVLSLGKNNTGSNLLRLRLCCTDCAARTCQAADGRRYFQ